MPSISVYSNANNSTRAINFDFVGDVLAARDSVYSNTSASCFEYYFKVTTGATQDNNLSFPIVVVKTLDDLALNPRSASQKQSQTNTANSYGSIKEFIIDYTYDFINGHTSNQFGSGCTLQEPMKFS